MTNDNLEKEIRDVEDIESPKLGGEESPKDLEEVNDEVLGRVKREEEGIEDDGQIISDTFQKAEGGDSGVIEAGQEENRKIVSEATGSSDKFRGEASDIVSAESPTALEILGGMEEKLEQLNPEAIAVVEKSKELKDVEINEANLDEVQKSVDDFKGLDYKIRQIAVALVSFEKENKVIDKETIDKHDKLVDCYEDIKNKVAPIVELYSGLETKIDDYKKQEQDSTISGPAGIEADTGSVEGEIGEDEQDYESEATKRINEWKGVDKDKKREEMEIYKNRLVEETRDIEKNIEKLRKELEENLEKRSEAAEKLDEQLKGGAEISGLEMFEREKIKEASRVNMIINENNLNIAKLEYLAKLSGTGDNFDNLMDGHKGEEISIEELEIMADDAKYYCDYLENMKEGEEEEAQEEVRGLLGRFGDAIRNDPELRKKLIAAGIIATLLVLAAGVGLGAVAAAELLGIDSALEALAWGGAIASIGVLIKERKMIGKALLGGGKMGFGGALMLASWMLDEENRDKVVKAASGLNFPSWYVAWKEFLGLGKENESKA